MAGGAGPCDRCPIIHVMSTSDEVTTPLDRTGASPGHLRLDGLPRPVAAVLLDMDGTLVDSDAAVERAWVTWARRYRVDVGPLLGIAHGSPAHVTVARVRPDLDAAAVLEAAAVQLALQYRDLSDVVAMPGAHRLVAALDGAAVPWTVVTSADRELAHARLSAAGLPVPATTVTVDDVAAGKPDPQPYRLAASRVGVDPIHCLAVEDSAPGIESARRAGAQTAALRGLPGDLVLRDLHDLCDRLEGTPLISDTPGR